MGFVLPSSTMGHFSLLIFQQTHQTCMTKLAQILQAVAKQIYQKKQNHSFAGKTTLSKRPSCKVVDLWLSISAFIDEVEVLDRCHYSRVFFRYADHQCNLKRSIIYVPVILDLWHSPLVQKPAWNWQREQSWKSIDRRKIRHIVNRNQLNSEKWTRRLAIHRFIRILTIIVE